MTQQQIVKLLDLPERTLRDWKKSRNRLYRLLEDMDYRDAKSKIAVADLDDIVLFEPCEFSQNLFWQTNQKSHQKVYSIISNYLGTLNSEDIKTLCEKYGKNMVRTVLEDKYKRLYKNGHISTSGVDINLVGSHKQNPIYKKILGIINDC